jgi:hypothetical protein
MTNRPAVRRTLRLLALLAPALTLALTTGCATRAVAVYERERLVDRIMSFDSDAKKSARRIKSFDAREGSTGGSGGAGGGCACN